MPSFDVTGRRCSFYYFRLRDNREPRPTNPRDFPASFERDANGKREKRAKTRRIRNTPTAFARLPRFLRPQFAHLFVLRREKNVRVFFFFFFEKKIGKRRKKKLPLPREFRRCQEDKRVRGGKTRCSVISERLVPFVLNNLKKKKKSENCF